MRRRSDRLGECIFCDLLCGATGRRQRDGRPYADGWQAGDNGGFGFLPWNFDNDTSFHVEGIRDINSSSPFNQLGTAWRLGLNYLSEGKDIVRVGRGLSSPLAVGQTLSVVVDPPSETAFFDIETIRLNTGGGSICYGGLGCSPGAAPLPRFAFSFFNWTDMENWGRWTVSTVGNTTLFNVDKGPGEHSEFPQGAAGTDQGVRVDFTLTGPDTYTVTATPLDNPGAAFTTSGALDNADAGSIDWIEFLHFGRPSNDAIATDFYIKSLEITGPGADTGDFDDDGDVDGADLLAWQRGFGRMSGATLGDGDANADGDVDAGDLAVWKAQFGGAGASIDAVPEPGGLALGCAAAAGLRLCWRRREPVRSDG
ncbi:MAG: hypothetical protein DCC67_00200 [Planctomycetota bacterium]|nr:MAG: hypothetical protein DCC67_00200 [Planctomycetota bacterium]